MRAPPSAPRHPGRLRRWWLDRSVRAKGMIVVAVPLIALVAVTSASLALQYKERQVRSVAITASALNTSAQQVLTDAVNAETGVRGYAATRDPLFLQPYDAILTRVDAGPGRAARRGRRRRGQRRGAGRGSDHDRGDGRAGPATLRGRRGRPGRGADAGAGGPEAHHGHASGGDRALTKGPSRSPRPGAPISPGWNRPSMGSPSPAWHWASWPG